MDICYYLKKRPIKGITAFIFVFCWFSTSAQLKEDCKYDLSALQYDAISGLSELNIVDLTVGKEVWLISDGLKKFRSGSFKKVRKYEADVTKKLIEQYKQKGNYALYNANMKYKYGKKDEVYEIEEDLFYKEGKLYREKLEPVKYSYCLRLDEQMLNKPIESLEIMLPFIGSSPLPSQHRSSYNYHDGTEPFDLDTLIGQPLLVVQNIWKGCVLKTQANEYIALFEYRKKPEEPLFQNTILKEKRNIQFKAFQPMNNLSLVNPLGGEAKSDEVAEYSLTKLFEKHGEVYGLMVNVKTIDKINEGLEMIQNSWDGTTFTMTKTLEDELAEFGALQFVLKQGSLNIKHNEGASKIKLDSLQSAIDSIVIGREVIISELLRNAYQYDCIAGRLDQFEREYAAYLKRNFTEQEIKAIREGRLYMGMRESVLYEIKGYPIGTNLTVVKGLEWKQLVYGRGVYLYLENGKLTGLQDSY